MKQKTRPPHNAVFAKLVSGTSKGKTMVQKFEEMLLTSGFDKSDTLFCHSKKDGGNLYEVVNFALNKEYKFMDGRKWKFDYADRIHKIAFEIDGGVHSNGRHVRPQGFIDDITKLNHATDQGWKVYRIATQEHIEFAREVIKLFISL